MQENHLPPFSIRPRFKVEVPFTSDAVISKIKTGLSLKNEEFKGKVVKDFAVLYIPEQLRHFWSPQLTVSLEDLGDGKSCELRGMYGPAPSVWTMFVFFYSLIGLAILFIFIIGGSNYFLGIDASVLWLIPLLLLVLFSLYLMAYTGQKLGHGEMESLHLFLESCLGHDVIGDQ